jgi:hypothetical protein
VPGIVELGLVGSGVRSSNSVDPGAQFGIERFFFFFFFFLETNQLEEKIESNDSDKMPVRGPGWQIEVVSDSVHEVSAVPC